MRNSTFKLLRCPNCRNHLEVARRLAHAGDGRLRDGLLGCASCGAVYPVLDWIPRMLPENELLPVERAVIDRARSGASGATAQPRVVEEDRLSPVELQQLIERRAREKVFYTEFTPKLQARAEKDYEYRVRHTEEKSKFVRTVEPFLSGAPRRILDLGGGQGGTLSAFRRRFDPETAILLDLDPDWLDVARWRDPECDVIRGDAVRMPLVDGAIDLLVTTATLEHIPDWRGAVAEITRVAREGLLCYGPNGAFPYDFGHLDAPFVTWLPKARAAEVARSWHQLRRTGRTMESIQSELAVTFFIPRRAVVRELRAHGVQTQVVFREFLRESVAENYHMRASGLKRVLARSAWLREVFAGVFLALAAEPNVYLYFRRAPGGQEPAASS